MNVGYLVKVWVIATLVKRLVHVLFDAQNFNLLPLDVVNNSLNQTALITLR